MKKSKTEVAENPKIALISGQLNAFPAENLARLSRRNYKTGIETANVEEAFKTLYTGKCSILLIHDTPELPASFVMRSQIVDPVAIITPTIVACHPAHRSDMQLIQEIGQPVLVEDTDNPAAFIGSFEWLLRRWGQGSAKKLHQARILYLKKDYKRFSQLLTALRGESDVQPLVTPCIAQLLMRHGDFKTTEHFLLDALREFPRNIGIIANLIEVYLKAAMPETALKVLSAARKNHGSVPLLFPDQIQAHLMLNQVPECIPLLETLVRENYSGRQAQIFLARCLYAEGYQNRFQQVVENLGSHEDEYRHAWHKTAI